jgi:hypothetical protein
MLAGVPTVESVAVIVKVDEPAVLGVPENTPADDRVKPAGSDPVVTENEYGAVPPVAVKVALYGRPTSACGKLVVVIDI